MANPWAKASLAITLTFGVVGYLDQVYSTPLTYYMYNELGITTQEYYVYKVRDGSTTAHPPPDPGPGPEPDPFPCPFGTILSCALPTASPPTH